MKQLFAGVVLIIVVGIAAFLYRNIQERPVVPAPAAPSQTAVNCTTDAKVCPDGSTVGRTGTDCAFAACPLPNAELTKAGVSYVIPFGYKENPAAIGTDTTMLAAYEKLAAAGQPDAIVVRSFPIPAGKTGNAVILANTMYESSGNLPKSMKEFAPVIINGNTFQSVVLERFEGQVHSAYYLVRTNDVLRFEVLEHNVTNWTDPKLVVGTLPQHKELLQMLSTLQLQTK